MDEPTNDPLFPSQPPRRPTPPPPRETEIDPLRLIDTRLKRILASPMIEHPIRTIALGMLAGTALIWLVAIFLAMFLSLFGVRFGR